MTDDTLTRLRAINPVTVEPPVEPIAQVQARIAAKTGARVGAERGGTARSSLPPASPSRSRVAIVAGVTAGQPGQAGRHPGSPLAPGTVTEAASVAAAGDGRGMLGLVQLTGSALSGRGGGLVSLWQCQPCARRPRTAGWIARTTDDGASWAVFRSPFAFGYAPAFSGPQTAWGQSLSRSPGQAGRGLFLPDGRIWVTHTGGRTWRWARLPGRSSLYTYPVTIAGGEVWALAGPCRPGCGHMVVHGPASGEALTATATPPNPDQPNVAVIAAGRQTAYVEAGPAPPLNVTSGAAGSHLYVTRDGGHSWRLTNLPCSTQLPTTELAADGPSSLWEQCATPSHGFLVARSTDGGQHWTAHPVPGAGGLAELRPVGNDTAWATIGAGPRTVLRTTDGGVSWRVVLHTSASATLLPMRPRSAAVDEILVHPLTGHRPAASNLVVVRTADGGRSWQRTVVALPAR